jgi:menaquinone-dependent protoporphyrinogen oxidase
VAEAIGQELGATGADVEVRRARDVRDLSPYQAVVVGTSVHMGRLPGEIPRFAKRHRRVLSRVPVAYFVVCLTMAEDTPENRQTTLAYLDPLRKAAPEVEPVDTGLFGGAILQDTHEFDRLFFLMKSIVRATAKELDDARDWEAIRAWARVLRPALCGS